MLRTLLIITCAFIAFPGVSFAQQTVEEIKLTDAGVKNWAAAMVALNAGSQQTVEDAREFRLKSDAEPGSDEYNAAVNDLVERMRTYDTEVVDIIQSHGFDSVEEWGLWGERIVHTYTFMLIHKEESIASAMDDVLKQMESLGVSEEDLQEARKGLQEVDTARRDEYAKLSERDKKIVGANMDLLKATLEGRPAKEKHE